MRTPRRSSRGFSLVELTITASICAIMAAIAVPRYTAATHRYRAQAAARRIVADLTVARTIARATSKDILVVFDPVARNYELRGVPNPDHPGADYIVDLSRDPYRVFLRQVDFASATQVTFNAFGLPSARGEITVKRDTTEITIIVDAQTGLTSMN